MKNEHKTSPPPNQACIHSPHTLSPRIVILRRKTVKLFFTTGSFGNKCLLQRNTPITHRKRGLLGASVHRGTEWPDLDLLSLPLLYANTQSTFAPVPMATSRFVRSCERLRPEPPARRDIARLLLRGRWTGPQTPRMCRPPRAHGTAGRGKRNLPRGASPGRPRPAPERAMTHKCSKEA